MMRLVYLTLFFILFGSVNAFSVVDYNRIRKTFHEAVFHPSKVVDYVELINSMEALEQPLLKAYMAGGMALSARESWNPYSKINFLTKYRSLINQAIQEDKSNLEIRFLRYSIEFNMPKVLRSEKDMVEDKKWIVDGLNAIEHFDLNAHFIPYIIELIKDTDSWNSAEIEMVEKKIRKCHN